MNEIERKQKIFQEILEEAKSKNPDKLPGEFTRADFIQELKNADIECGKDRAIRILETKVERGILSKRVTERSIYYSVV